MSNAYENKNAQRRLGLSPGERCWALSTFLLIIIGLLMVFRF